MCRTVEKQAKGVAPHTHKGLWALTADDRETWYKDAVLTDDTT